MEIIPAIDLRGGKVVRLVHGDMERETVYSHDPAAVAREFFRQGASRLHLIDLEGAFQGSPRNEKAIRSIVGAVDMTIQVGGGIRSLETAARLFDAGVDKVILGTVAAENPALAAAFAVKFGTDKVIAAIDAREGVVASRGWVEATAKKVEDLALTVEQAGIKEIIVTDILRDGTLEGPNIGLMQELLGKIHVSLIASGGVSSLEDIRALSKLSRPGLAGVIVGQALYTGRFSLAQAQGAAAVK
ncbi:MAG TPA: 1-(5-phosphoribosyl)-5-[(5-phosphoribosylamino)methylideneamino]imidazole-4-carboxamide isomerase [Firmicutes bacterium]|nr:1-(5-phosphoribosyl)-5-[(5-phosphoribosylamino)methylideneamino]imidazole-4-carboxamide isomerase [Bacillota bacterium]